MENVVRENFRNYKKYQIFIYSNFVRKFYIDNFQWQFSPPTSFWCFSFPFDAFSILPLKKRWEGGEKGQGEEKMINTLPKKTHP